MKLKNVAVAVVALALAAGMTDHLTKPLDRIVMLQALANVCTARGQNSR